MSVCRMQNSFYKTSGNVVTIDPRLKTFPYSHQLDKMRCYFFDTKMTCNIATDIPLSRLNSKISDIFPKDMFSFFKNIIENTYSKSQTIHAVVNDYHVLYTSELYVDHKDRILGVIIYEVPFSKVEVFNNETIISQQHASVIIDDNGVVVGIQKNHWDAFMKQIGWNHAKSDAIHLKYVKDMFDPFGFHVFQSLYSTITEGKEKTMTLLNCTERDNRQLTFLSNFSPFVMDKVYLLVTIELVDDIEVESIENETIQQQNDINKYIFICSCCNRVLTSVDDSVMDTHKSNVIHYKSIIHPMNDKTYNLPQMGKRGLLGQQSPECLEKNTDGLYDIWIKKKKEKHYSTGNEKSTICNICRDEWKYIINLISQE